MSLSYSIISFVVLLILKFVKYSMILNQAYGSMLGYAKLKCMVWKKCWRSMVGCVS
jgi:hypothetical protein